jgi:hypothetical protein
MPKPAGLLLAAIALVSVACGGDDLEDDSLFVSEFNVNKANLASTGSNPFFILEPGYGLVLEGGGVLLTISVLNETKLVDGIETRIVEERETEDGELAEVARNYFAIDRLTKDVYYFGEDVDFFANGRINGHEGTWLSGVDGARFGLLMPGQITVDARYYQEYAPGVALDRAKNVSVSESCKVPAGDFTGCLRVEESNPLEGTKEQKYYAPNVGLVRDGDELQLVRYGYGIINQ